MPEGAAGLPVQFYDATANTDDSYVELVADAGNRTYYYIWVFDLDDNAATLSLDGGNTDHLDIPVITAGHAYLLHIPAGFRSLHAKNETATSDYTELLGSIW